MPTRGSPGRPARTPGRVATQLMRVDTSRASYAGLSTSATPPGLPEAPRIPGEHVVAGRPQVLDGAVPSIARPLGVGVSGQAPSGAHQDGRRCARSLVRLGGTSGPGWRCRRTMSPPSRWATPATGDRGRGGGSRWWHWSMAATGRRPVRAGMAKPSGANGPEQPAASAATRANSPAGASATGSPRRPRSSPAECRARVPPRQSAPSGTNVRRRGPHGRFHPSSDQHQRVAI